MRAPFVIVNYNRRDTLTITLSKTKALISNNFNEYKIVLVDNASTDGSAAMMKNQLLRKFLRVF
ncbi:MAG: glycosyltransferase [Bacteroidota bacterium]|nr:glycosyltransferase [Bacteroidota bacterium]